MVIDGVKYNGYVFLVRGKTWAIRYRKTTGELKSTSLPGKTKEEAIAILKERILENQLSPQATTELSNKKKDERRQIRSDERFIELRGQLQLLKLQLAFLEKQLLNMTR